MDSDLNDVWQRLIQELDEARQDRQTSWAEFQEEITES
jgi:hypothetical protein